MPNLRNRGDFVISMTLAETFLLLVFMLWYSIRPRIPASVPTTIEVIRAENEELKNQIVALKKQIGDLDDKVKDYDRRLEWWKTRFNLPVPGSEKELKPILIEAGRGKPKCQDNNILLEISLIDGVTTLKVLAGSSVLSTALLARHIAFSPGATVVSPAEVDAVLAESRNYRKAPGPEGDCRFDYRFVFSSDHDYYEGRERFEKYFYSTERRRVVQTQN
jgi:hypothetical protein